MGGWYRQGVDVNQEVMEVSEDIKAGKSSLDVDYGMSKSVKEKDSGDFVYSFNAEKESPTRRTLHAAVNTRKGANGELFIGDIITQPSDSVNTSDENPHSDRNKDSVSNHSLLANALEGVAQNDIEKSKLAQYKEKISLIEAEQAKLTETRAKIKELSFAKGARDIRQIKKPSHIGRHFSYNLQIPQNKCKHKYRKRTADGSK